MDQLFKYARREPTTDWVMLKYGGEGSKRRKWDVVLYEDEACTKLYVRYGWADESRPRYGDHQLKHWLNSYKWGLKWLPDLPGFDLPKNARQCIGGVV